MSELNPVSEESRSGTTKRNLIVVFSAVPIVALFVLLGWAVARSGGNPGEFGINSKFGEVSIESRLAREFANEGLDGHEVSLSELRGSVVMLDFWSSWCPPCRQEAPVLAQLYREYDGRNVKFVGVAIWDDPEDVARYVREFGLIYPNVLDERGRIAIDYGVRGIPEKFFIDSEGNLVRKFVGPISAQKLRDALDGLLASEPTSRTEATDER